MAKAPRGSAPGRTWRAQRAAGRALGEKNAGRIIFSLLTLGLLGLLGWYVLAWLFLPRIYFAGIPIVDYSALELAPIPFALEDAEAFSQWAPDEPENGVIWRNKQTVTLLSTLAEQLQGTVKRSKDVLVFYVWAQGISSEGKAYLVCGNSDDSKEKEDERRFPLSDLLEQLKACPGKLKLLILDTSHVGCDPRLGMVVNEFPQLLEEELKSVDDPGLWVLTSAGPLETSHVHYARQRSVFGYYVVEGLQGLADHDENEVVDLNELYRFTSNHVAEWVLVNNDREEIQTPRLLRAGGYPVDLDDTPDLLPVGRKTQASSKNRDGKKDSDAKEQQSKGKNAPREQVRRLLTDAWEFRDTMQQRDAGLPWSPVDYDPHRWRAYQESLLGYEARFRAGTAFTMDRLRDDLNEIILNENRKGSFQRKADQQIGFDQSGEDGDTIREVIHLKNDLLFRAPYYVRWVIHYSQARGTRHPLHNKVAQLLKELKRYVDALESLQSSSAEGSPYDDSKRKLDRLREFRMSQDGITLADLDQQIRDRLAGEADDAKTKGNAGQIEALLSTPLLPAPQRDALIRRLEKLSQTELRIRKTWYKDNYKAKTQELYDRQLECIAHRTELHNLLRALATPSSDAASTAVKGDAWQEYRNRGTVLRTFYANLPDSIIRRIDGGQTTETDPVEFANRLEVDRHLRLLDARDVHRIDRPVSTVCTIRMPSRPEDSLVLDGPAGTVVLDRKIPTSFPLTLSTNDETLKEIQVRFDYQKSRLSVKDSKGRTAEAGRWMPVALDGNGKATATFQALPLGPSETEILMTVYARTGESADEPESVTIMFRRAAPDVVDLLIHRIIHRPDRISELPAVKTSSASHDKYEVRPFPNRTTAYRFDLVNLSDYDKEVEVYLLAVPKLEIGETLTPEHLVTNGMPNRLVRKLLAEPIKMTLPKKGVLKRISFPALKAEEKPAQPEGETPDPPSGDDVTHGLACLIRETSPKEGFWLKVLDVSPRPPRTYLLPKVTYDPVSGKLNVVVGPIEDEQGLRNDLLPALSAENKLPLKMETVQQPDKPGKKLSTDMTSTEQAVNLFVHTTARPGHVVRVHLSANGYPRAFVYDVDCHPDTSPNTLAEPERSLRKVRILTPEENTPFQVPPAKEPLLYFTFQVDAPEVAFLDPSHGEMVETRILDAQGERELSPELRQQFPRDRQVSASLLPVEREGVIRFKTTVSDFRIPLPNPNLEDMGVLLQARLLLRDQEPVEKSVGIVLDGSPPKFHIIEPAGPVVQGQPMRVAVKLDDKDGAGVREIGFALHRQKELEAGEELEFKPGTMTSNQIYATTLPTADLVPGPYYLHVKATDRVKNSIRQIQRVEVKEKKTGNGSTRVVEQKGSIQGLVREGDKEAGGMTVTIEGPDQPPAAKTGKDGRYSFENLKPGEYTIHVEGYPRGSLIQGSRKVTVQAGKKANGDVSAK